MDWKELNHCWFAIQVKMRQEFVTAQLLQNKGYEQFVPWYYSQHQWSDRKKSVKMPLFAGYIFCRFDSEIRWPIVSTQGVIRIVGISKEPIPVPDDEVAAIQKAVLCALNPRRCDYLNVGNRVRITSGPLTGVEGVLTNIRNQRQLILSINLLQSSVVVDVEQCSMVSASHCFHPESDVNAAALAAGAFA